MAPTVAPPTLFSSVKQGFGFGIGNSIAMNIFRSDPRPQHVIVSPETNHAVPKEYTECLEMMLTSRIFVRSSWLNRLYSLGGTTVSNNFASVSYSAWPCSTKENEGSTVAK